MTSKPAPNLLGNDSPLIVTANILTPKFSVHFIADEP